MSKSREIEFKTMLTAEEFTAVYHHYQLTETDFKTQTNCYFDTVDGQLRTRGWGLRIRLYPDRGELTLKVPANDGGLWEYTDPLTYEEVQDLRSKGKILPTGTVAGKLQEARLSPGNMKLLADLTTHRAEFTIPEGLLALDENFYGTTHDYELELEVTDSVQGKEAFLSLLAQLKLTYRPAENKIARAFKVK